MSVFYKLVEQRQEPCQQNPHAQTLTDHWLEEGFVDPHRQSFIFGKDVIEPPGGIFTAHDGQRVRVHHNSFRKFQKRPGGISLTPAIPDASCFLRAKVRQPNGTFSTEPRLLRIDVNLTPGITGAGQHQQSRR